MFEWRGEGLSESERVKQNVSNIIQTRKNEVRFDVDFGITPDYIDKPISEATSIIITEMVNVVTEMEPRATVTPNDIIAMTVSGEQDVLLGVSDSSD